MTHRLPEGSWDCHAHVFGDPDEYPPAPHAEYAPPSASLADYLGMLDRHGIARGVLVQPSVYGFDNRCLLDALERAEGRLLGVVVPAPDTGPQELEDMHGRGVRGIRCNLVNAGGLSALSVLAWQPLMAELGWHVAFHVDIETIPDLRTWLEPFTIPVVIDHMGRPHGAASDRGAAAGSGRVVDLDPEFEGSAGVAVAGKPRLQQLVALVAEGACYVKLSAPYRLSDGPAPWADVTPTSRALLAADPSMCLWGTDWPHVHTPTPIHVADVVATLEDWCPGEESKRRVLVEAPEALFSADRSGAAGPRR